MKWKPEAFPYKLACDGLDLVTKFEGQLVGEFGKQYVRDHCSLDLNSFDAESFIEQCIDGRQASGIIPRNLPPDICDKYQVGIFSTTPENCTDNPFILFNKEQINEWGRVNADLWYLTFMVVPSRGWDGKINEIGFRLLDTARVHEAFKWLFPVGQQATFGLHLCDRKEKLVLVEGFQDMMAFRESGYTNTVGLGAAEITPNHLHQLDVTDFVFCPDMDSWGYQVRQNYDNIAFYTPDEKDPYEAWQKFGRVDLIEVH